MAQGTAYENKTPAPSNEPKKVTVDIVPVVELLADKVIALERELERIQKILLNHAIY